MIGSKTQKLIELRDHGFNVPAFVAIDSTEMIQTNEQIADRVRRELQADRYAVRSSALAEDSDTQSMAGQFRTELDVAPDELEQAIDRVRADAKEKLGDLTEFSLLIQVFIEPTFAGVTFTRNPLGGRETVVEFHAGRGDQVVGGVVRPMSLTYYQAQETVVTKLPSFAEARKTFLAIEQVFGAPQDIEWGIAGDEWFILQSRPITARTEEMNRTDEFLDLAFQTTKRFYFEKTGVCDVAPHPSVETLRLLHRVYADSGPVARAYKKIGVTYRDTHFLIHLSQTLYIDRERELRSLFPSHSYFFGNTFLPRPVRLRGFYTALKNTKRLQSIAREVPAPLVKELRTAVDRERATTTFDAALDEFLEDYELVFTINLMAEAAVRSFEKYLPSTVSLAEALRYVPSDMPEPWTPPTDLIGNTFELSDTSVFVPSPIRTESPSIPNTIPVAALRVAQMALRLREYGRWLALRHLTHIKSFRKISPPSPSHFVLPSILTDQPIPSRTTGPLGVSAGIAEGKLSRTPEPGTILVVETLTPDLANHHSLLGVISANGGMLSHFAIIARELNLPVIVQANIATLHIGKRVRMNGSTGQIDSMQE